MTDEDLSRSEKLTQTLDEAAVSRLLQKADRVLRRHWAEGLDYILHGTPPGHRRAANERHYPPGSPATVKQIQRLKDWGSGYDARRMTADEASDVIALAEGWAADHPASDEEVMGYDDAYADGETAWPPTTAVRREVALIQRFRWPRPQYKREDDAARDRERAAFGQMSLAERIALRRSQGAARLTTYVKTRLFGAEPDLRAAIQALLSEAEWQAALTDPGRHQTGPA